MIEYPTVISPCTSICKLDKNSVCIGCSRTAKEIQEWYLLDDVGKQQILDNIKLRKVKNANANTE